MRISETEYLQLSESGAGYCPDCNAVCDDTGFEPDATRRKCHLCGGRRAMGIEQALLCMHLAIADDRPDGAPVKWSPRSTDGAAMSAVDAWPIDIAVGRSIVKAMVHRRDDVVWPWVCSETTSGAAIAPGTSPADAIARATDRIKTVGIRDFRKRVAAALAIKETNNE